MTDQDAVPQGYKRTEVGVIPEDWDVYTLSDVSYVRTGPFGSALHERDYVDFGTPIITVEHLSEYGILHENLPLISDFDKLRLKSYSLLVNDIVFSRVGSVDRNSLVTSSEEGWLFSGRLLRVRISNNIAYPPYVSYYFHSEPFKNRIRGVAVGQTMASLNTKILNDIKVVIPLLSEQHAIAAALSDADGLIGALDNLISKKRDMKQAAMQQLLTGRTRLPGFEGEWEEKRLGNIITFLSTANNPRSDLNNNGDVEYIHYGDVHGHSKPVLDCCNDILPRIDSELISNVTRLEDGDLVLVDASEDLEGVGKSVEIRGVSNRHVISGLHTIVCRGLSGYWADGFKAYLQFIPSIKRQLLRVTTGISVYAISKQQIADIIVFLPSIKEQTAIATVLSDMDAEIAALERRRDKAKEIKQGMMQQLLTGKVRLVSPEEMGEHNNMVQA